MMKSRCVSTSQKTVRVMAGSDSILDGGPGQNEDARRPSPDAREGETDGGRWGIDEEGWPALRQESRRLLGAARPTLLLELRGATQCNVHASRGAAARRWGSDAGVSTRCARGGGAIGRISYESQASFETDPGAGP